MDPALLAAIGAGQVLDADPIAGVTISAVRSPVSINGRQLLVTMHEGRSLEKHRRMVRPRRR